MAASDAGFDHLVAGRSAGLRSSAIRDLLALTASPGILSLAGGLPAFETLPAADVSDAVAALVASPDALQYAQTEGEPVLRAWIAGHELDGAETGRVLVTHGSQQALHLLVEALVAPGDVIVVERPSYLGMLQALATSGAEVVDVPGDGDGMDVDELAALLASGLRPKLCYLAPTFQNPSGSLLPDGRRALLGDLARRYGFVVIDDDPYRELGFGPVPQRLRTFVPDDLAVTLGSFSKTLAPGLRVGWVHAPRWLVPVLTRLKQAADLHTNTLGQRIVADLVARPGWLDSAIAQRRQLYRRRADAAVAALAHHLPGVAVAPPRGGMFVWVDLGVDADDLLRAALAEGVAFVPGSAFDHRLRPSTFGRLCYATLDGPDLEEAAGRLARARREHRRPVLHADVARLTPSSLLAAVGDWRADGRPAFRALAAAIADAADRGDLPAGALLPPERRLAEALGVSRGTVVAAYDVLRASGIVLRRQGAGTWLPAGGVPTEAWTHDDDAGLRARRLAARVVSPLAGAIDLGISALPEPWGLEPADLAVSVEELTEAGGGHGYHPLGVPALREALAARYTAAGWPTDADNVAVTLGAQHGIALVARLLLHPGDVVAVESPTYPGAIDVLARSGAHFVTVATDGAGARAEHLARHAEREHLRLTYLVPTCHNPTGTVLPESRRHEMATIVDAHRDLWLVEDEALAPLRFAAPPPLPVAAHCRTERHVVIGSLAKVVWGGLRVGWIRATPATIARLGRLRAALDLGGSVVAQVAALGAVSRLEASLDQLRPLLAGRAAHLSARLRHELPEWRFVEPDGGLSLWVQLPRGTGDELAAAGLAHGVSVLPGSAASVDEVHLDHVRISFVAPSEVLDDAVARLTKSWENVR